MLRIVEETVRSITPHVLGVDAVEELPEADPQASVDFLSGWLEKGIPEFQIVTNTAFLALNLYSFIKKGRLFPQLDNSKQAELLERLYDAKGVLAHQFLYFLANPAVSSYYSRIDVQKMLGFDIDTLKEESERRLVTREGGPLPPRDTAAESPADEGER
ncbi:MAG: hypothetical protein JJE48_10800 [Actinobacteria bacterium]|nr:hypothetical protein [Actinomycetota bacterium]